MECSKCKQDKPPEAFNWENKAQGKRQNVCRACFSEYNKERYRKNADLVKDRVKRYREENPSAVLATKIRACEKKPTPRNAARVIDAAIKAGEITRPGACSGCGASSDDVKIEAHHHDYTRPLDVIWLCPKCHSLLDIERRTREGKPYCSACRQVRCTETGEVFPSITRAAAWAHRTPGSLHQCLSGKSETCGGYHWERV